MRKLRIHVDPTIHYRDFELPEDWDELPEGHQYRIIRDHAARLVDEVVETYGEVVETGETGEPLAVALDDTHRIAVARLAPGQTLTVTAPPAIADVMGKDGFEWVTITFDDFGVRPTFTRNRSFVASNYAGTGELYRAVNASTVAIEAEEAQVARVVFEPRGTKRRPTWHAIGHELIPAAEAQS